MFYHSDAAALKRRRGLRGDALESAAKGYERHGSVMNAEGKPVRVHRTVKLGQLTGRATGLVAEFEPPLPDGRRRVTIEAKSDLGKGTGEAVRGELFSHLGHLVAEHNRGIRLLTEPEVPQEVQIADDGFRVYPPQAAPQEAA